MLYAIIFGREIPLGQPLYGHQQFAHGFLVSFAGSREARTESWL